MLYSQTLAYVGVPTIPLSQAQAGDCVFCTSPGFVGWAIRLGQKIRGYGKYTTWSHVAWLDRPVRDDSGKVVDWYLGQAQGRGVYNTQLLSEHGGQYEIISLSAFPRVVGTNQAWEQDRQEILTMLRSQLGTKYGFLTILSIAFNVLTPKFIRVDFRRDGTWICSGLYAYGLLSGGGKITGDVYQQFPAELAAIA